MIERGGVRVGGVVETVYFICAEEGIGDVCYNHHILQLASTYNQMIIYLSVFFIHLEPLLIF